jgi:histidyl-tRNA synthetase
MRDFYPEDMVVRNRIFDSWRVAAERHGFRAYDAPVVEHLDLLKRKSGEEIINQIYAFKDKSGRELALRPEMTPSLARMIAARQGSLTFPVKWYTIAQCFRYERMTRGRKREHYQLNLDIVGEASVTAEVEIIATAVLSLSLLGLHADDYNVFFSSRTLLGDLLVSLDVPPNLHEATFLALDKRGKISEDELLAMLRDAGHTRQHCDAIFRLMDVDTLDQAAALLPDDTPSLNEVQAFSAAAEHYELSDILRFDISVVRGLTYYTGIVFEAYDPGKSSRAILGGGRYDDLLQNVGGKPQTGVGLGFGDVVVTDLLRELGREDKKAGLNDVALGYMEVAQRNLAMRLACKLRSQGANVDLALSTEKARQFFSRVAKQNYAKAAYLGPDDVTRGSVRIKDLQSREESEIPISS